MGRKRWDAGYPHPARLREEVDAMAQAYVETLVEAVPGGEIAGIYAKGSTRKRWDTPLDYVPEVSDVDLHVLLKTEAAAVYLSSVERALSIARNAVCRYREAIETPVHIPRPQVQIANFLYSQPDYVPSPAGTVKTVFGSPLEEQPRDPAVTRELSRRQLAEPRQYLDELGMQVIDKPGKYISVSLRTMSWRVSPTAPRALEVLGLAFETAWNSNRTALVRHLEAAGEQELASDYVAFYLRAWDYFLSGNQDEAAGSEALLAGSRVLARGVEIGRAGEPTP